MFPRVFFPGAYFTPRYFPQAQPFITPGVPNAWGWLAGAREQYGWLADTPQGWLADAPQLGWLASPAG